MVIAATAVEDIIADAAEEIVVAVAAAADSSSSASPWSVVAVGSTDRYDLRRRRQRRCRIRPRPMKTSLPPLPLKPIVTRPRMTCVVAGAEAEFERLDAGDREAVRRGDAVAGVLRRCSGRDRLKTTYPVDDEPIPAGAAVDRVGPAGDADDVVPGAAVRSDPRPRKRRAGPSNSVSSPATPAM